LVTFCLLQNKHMLDSPSHDLLLAISRFSLNDPAYPNRFRQHFSSRRSLSSPRRLFGWRQYVFYCLLIHIDGITSFEKFFIDIFLPHFIHWTLRRVKIHNALTRHVNGLTFSQKVAVHIFM